MSGEQEILDAIQRQEEYRQFLDYSGDLTESESQEIDAKITALRIKLRELQTPPWL